MPFRSLSRFVRHLVTGTAATALVVTAAGAAVRAMLGRAHVVARAFPAIDTLVVYGPTQFNGSSGQGQTYVERFTVASPEARFYTLRLINGASDGTRRASKVIIKLNGFEVVSQNEVTQSVPQLERPVALTAIDTLRVTVAGSGSPYISLSILGTPDSSFNVAGPTTYAITSGTSRTVNESFALPAGTAGPHRLYVVNGAADGTERVTSATITLNGVQVVGSGVITGSVGSLTKTVTLTSSNTLQLNLNGPTNSNITVRFTAVDVLPPVLTIDAPAQGLLTSNATVAVSGSVEDRLAAQVTVNGTAASVVGTAYSGTVTLGAEGSNLITVVATDASGRHTDSTRTVILDTQSPALAVSAPADGLLTSAATVDVTGTASDANLASVAVNGTPLVVTGGSFSAPVPLAEGPNVLLVTATDGAGNSQTVTRTVTRDATPPALVVTSPADGASTEATSIAVTGTVTDASAVTVTVNGQPVTVGAEGAFSTSVPLNEGPNTIVVSARDAANNTTAATRTVTRQLVVPPDPSTLATPLDPTAISTVAASTAFLYSGPDPIQTGVAPGTIQPLRAAVLRGRVVDRAGAPMPGVLISALDHPEFGQTVSRADGRFDLAVNGGSDLTASYARAGHLPAQRTTSAPWQGFAELGDVALTPLDSAVTTIDFSQAAPVARGSAVTDDAGTRQATLVFEQGTQATMVLSDGSTQPLSSVSVRATEYTIGASGPAAMPGLLPAASAYTYAVELSVDEAMAAGARSVEFTKAVSFYVDNFLNLPTGGRVPLGTYDRRSGRWVPERDGRVIKVLTTSPVQIAASYPDTATPASAALLDSLGVTAAELDRLGTLYAAGTTLWRAELTHLTPADLNFAFGFPPKAAPPNLPPIPPTPPDGCPQLGSVIGCEAQTLGEEIRLAGVPFTLHYQSDRTLGYAVGRQLDLPRQTRVDTSALTGTRVLKQNEFPSHMLEAFYVLDVAGKQVVARPALGSFIAATSLRWDGRDVFGRTVNGAVRAKLSVGFAFQNLYAVATSGSAGGSSFGASPPASAIASISRERGVLQQVWEGTLGSWDNRAGLALGGWSLTAHHVYDPTSGTLYLGSGERRAAAALGNVARLIPATRGTFCSAFNCGIPVFTRSQPGQPSVDAAGRLYIPYSIDGSGTTAPGIVRILGTNGTFVDSIPNAGRPTSAVVAPDGTLYLAERDQHRVRRWRAGVFTTFAGTGTAGFSGDGGQAANAQLNRPTGIALGPDGSLYIADGNNHRIRRVAPDGTISTFAGTGATTIVADGGLATATPVPSPAGVAVSPDGAVIYLTANLVRRIAPSGRVSTVAGYSTVLGPGATPATSTFFNTSHVAVTVQADGGVLFSQPFRVWRATLGGSLEVVAGTGSPRCVVLTQAIVCDPTRPADGSIAAQTKLENVIGLAAGPDGTIYLSESSGSSSLAHIRTIRPALPGLSATNMLIASDNGAVVYEFNAVGRHLRTRHGLTGKTMLVFDYDAAGRLAAIRDSLGNTTTIERTTSGVPTAIVAPFGQRTTLTLDANEYLQEVRDPAGNRVQLTHTASGLLTELRDPRDNVHRFAYDTLGRLVADSAPNGGAKLLARTTRDTGYSVTVTTAMSRATSYAVDFLGDRTERRAVTDPAGVVTRGWRTPSGVDSTRSADGTLSIVQRSGDPRFGAQVSLPSRTVVRLPSNDSLVVLTRRVSTRSDSANPFSLTQQIDSVRVNGNLWRSVYDAATRRHTTTSPEGRQSFRTVDSLGRLRVARTPGLDSVVIGYDARGRLEQLRRGGRIVSYTYDLFGRRFTRTDALGRTDSVFYDAAGRLQRHALPGGLSVSYGYDSSGNLVSITPPGRPSHDFGYTSVDLLDGYAPPALGDTNWTTTFRYNADHQLDRVTRPDGGLIELGYDPAGRPSTITFDRGTVTYGYSSTTGSVTQIDAPGGSVLTFGYNGALPTMVSWAGPVQGTITVGYDANFRLRWRKLNGADSVGFSYDRDGLLSVAGALGLKRHAQHGEVERDSIGSVIRTWSRDGHGALSAATASFADSLLYQASYVRDSAGRIVELTETVEGTPGTVAFTYDSVGRLWEVRRDGVLRSTYGYDANGNRLTLTTSLGVTSGTYDAQDRLLAYAGADYGYSPSGDLRSKVVGSDTTLYTYDRLGNLTAVRLPDGTVIDYVVDGQNRRIGKRVNGTLVQGFLYTDQLAIAAELDGSGQVVSRFVYATSRNVPEYVVRGGATYRLVLDHLGSVRLAVNVADGTVVQRLDYDEFGRVLHNTNPGFQPFGYAGGLMDEHTGLVRFGARDYDPVTGRWTARDPLLFGGKSSNLYAYVLEDPVNRIDPEGKQAVLAGPLVPIILEGVGLGAIGAVAAPVIFVGTAIYAGYLLSEALDDARDDAREVTEATNRLIKELCRDFCLEELPSKCGDLQVSEFRRCLEECEQSYGSYGYGSR